MSWNAFKAFGFEFSGPTWLAIVFFATVIILAVSFGEKRFPFTENAHESKKTTSQTDASHTPSIDNVLTETDVDAKKLSDPQGIKGPDAGPVTTNIINPVCPEITFFDASKYPPESRKERRCIP